MGIIPDDEFLVQPNKAQEAPQAANPVGPINKTTIADDDFLAIPKDAMPSTGTATLYGAGRNIIPSIAGLISGTFGGMGGAVASGGSPAAAYTVPAAAFAASAAGAAGTAKVQEMFWKPGLREQIAASDSPNAYSWGGMIPGFATGRPVSLKDFATKAGRTQMAIEAGSEFGGDVIVNGILGEQQSYGQSAGQAAFEALLQGHQTRVGSAISQAPINLANYLVNRPAGPATPITPGTQQQIVAEARGAQDIVPPTGPMTPAVPAVSQPQVVPTVTQGQAAAPVVATPTAAATPAVATPAAPASPAATAATAAGPAATATPAAPVVKPSVQPGTAAAVTAGQDGRGQVTHIPDHIPAHETLAPEQLRAAHAAMEPAQAANSIIGLNAEAHRRNGINKPADPAFVERILTHTGTALRDLSTRDQGLAISTGEGISRLLERHIATAKSNPEATPYKQEQIFEMEYRKASIDAIVDHIRKGGREPLPYSMAGAAEYVKNMKYYAGKDAQVEASRNTPPTPEQAEAEAGVDIGEVPINFSTKRWQADPKLPNGGSVVQDQGQAPMVEYNGRLIVLRNINGVQVPFYLSTGDGGKKDVPSGKWYPFFGVGDGWLNKTGGQDMANYYNRKDLAAVARQLDRTIGDIRHQAGRDLFPKVGNKESFAHINQGLTPTENGTPETRAKLEANMKGLFDRLDAAAAQRNPKPVATQPDNPQNGRPQRPGDHEQKLKDAGYTKFEDGYMNPEGDYKIVIKGNKATAVSLDDTYDMQGKPMYKAGETISYVGGAHTLDEIDSLISSLSGFKRSASWVSKENGRSHQTTDKHGLIVAQGDNFMVQRAAAFKKDGSPQSYETLGFTKTLEDAKKLFADKQEGRQKEKAIERRQQEAARQRKQQEAKPAPKPAAPASTELTPEAAKPAEPKPAKPTKPLTKKEQRAAEKKAKEEEKLRKSAEYHVNAFKRDNPDAPQEVIDAFSVIMNRTNGHGEPESADVRKAREIYNAYERKDSDNIKKIVEHEGVESYDQSYYDDNGVLKSGTRINLKEGYTLDIGPGSGNEYQMFSQDEDGNFDLNFVAANNDAHAAVLVDDIVKKSDLPEMRARRDLEDKIDLLNRSKNALNGPRGLRKFLEVAEAEGRKDDVRKLKHAIERSEETFAERQSDVDKAMADYESKFGKYEKKAKEPEPEGRDPAEEEPDPDEDPEDVAEREALFAADQEQADKSEKDTNLAKSDREIYDELRAKDKAKWKKGSDKSIAAAEKRLKDASDQLEKAQKSGKVKQKQLDKLIETKALREYELGYLTDPDYKSPSDVQFEEMEAAGFGPVRDMYGTFDVTVGTTYINKDKSYDITPVPQGDSFASKKKYLVSKVTSISEDGFVKSDQVGWFDSLDEAVNATKQTGGEAAPAAKPNKPNDPKLVKTMKDAIAARMKDGKSVEDAAHAVAYDSRYVPFDFDDPKGHSAALYAIKEAAGLPSDHLFPAYGMWETMDEFKNKKDTRHWKPSEPIGDEAAQEANPIDAPSVIGDKFPKSVYDMGYSDIHYTSTIESPDGYAIGPAWDTMNDLKAGEKIKGWRVSDPDDQIIGTYKTLKEALDAVSKLDENLEVNDQASKDDVSEGEKSKETPYKIMGEGWVSERRYLDHLIEIMDWSEKFSGNPKAYRKLRNELAKKLGVNIQERAKQLKSEKKASEQANEEKPRQIGGGVPRGELFDPSDDFNLSQETAAPPPVDRTEDTTGDFSTGAEPANIVAARQQLSKLEKSGQNPEQQAALRKTIAEYNESVKPKAEGEQKKPNTVVARLLMELDKATPVEGDNWSGNMHKFENPKNRDAAIAKIKEIQKAGGTLQDILSKFGLKDDASPDAKFIKYNFNQATFRERVENDEVAKGILDYDYTARGKGNLVMIRPTAEIAEEMNVGIKNVSRLMQQLVREKILSASKGTKVNTANGSYTTTYSLEKGVSVEKFQKRLREIAGILTVLPPKSGQAESQAEAPRFDIKGVKGFQRGIQDMRDLLASSENDQVRALRQANVDKMEALLAATKSKPNESARLQTQRRKLKELLDGNNFRPGRSSGLEFAEMPKVRDIMDRIASYERLAKTSGATAESVLKPVSDNEPASITEARQQLSRIISNMSRGEGWDAKRRDAEAKIEQFELENKLLSGNYEPTAQDLEIISNAALEEFVAKFGSGDVDPAITSIVEAELASRFEAQERSGVEDTTAGDTTSQKGDLLADIKNLIAEHGAKYGIPTLPKEFGAESLSVLREQLSKGQVMSLMRNPVGMGKIDVERAKTDATYRKEMKDRAEGQLSDLAMALSELGWTQFDPANFNSDDLVQAIVAAGKGEMLTPKGGVLGVAAPVDMQAAGIIKRLYEPDAASPDDPFSRRDLSPEAAKRELERRQAQNAKNRAGDPEARKGYSGIVSRVTDEMRLRGDLTPKEIEGVTRIMNKIGAQFFEGVKMKVGAGSRLGEYGQYQTVERIITIFKDAIRNGKFEETAAHEIAHHIARFLPEADRQAVISELHVKRGEFLKRNKGLENLFSATDRRDWAKKRFTAQQIANANLQDPTAQIVKLDAEELKKEGYKPNEYVYRLKLTDETYRLTNPNEYFAEEFKDNVMRELNSDPVYLGRSRNWKEKLASLWQDIKINFRRMFGKEIANKILSNFAKGRYNPDEEGSADITGIGSDRQWDGGTTFSKKDRKLKADPVVDTESYDEGIYPIGEALARSEDGSTNVVNILGRNKMSPERKAQIDEFVKDSSVKHALYRGQKGGYETLDANMSEDGMFHIASDPDYAAQYAEDHNKKLPDDGTESAVIQVYINAKNIVDISKIGHSIDSRANIEKMRKLDNDGLSANEHIAAREDEFINKIISEVRRINEGKDLDLTELKEGLHEAFDEARDDHLNRLQTSVWQVFSHHSIHSLFRKYGVDAIKYSDSDLRTAQGGKRGGKDSYVLADPRRIKAAFGGNDVNTSSSNIFQAKREPKQSELDMRVSGEVRLQDAMGVANKNKLTEAEFERLVSQDPSFNQREWQSVMEEGHFTDGGPDARLKGARVYKRIALPSMADPSAEVSAQAALPKNDVSNSGNGQVFKSVRDASTDQSEDPEVFKNPRSGESVTRSAWDIVSGRFFSGMSGKAHQNAKRHPYSKAVKAIANIIHSRPGTQSDAYGRDLPTAISTARSKYHTRLNKIMEPLRGMLGGFKDTDQGTAKQQREEVYQALNDMITGRKNITSGPIGEAAAGLKSLLSEIHDYRTAAGEAIGTVADYYPAVYDSPRIGDNRKDFIKDAKRAYEIQLGEMDPDTLRRELGLTKKEYEEMADNDPDKLEEIMDELTEQKALGLYNSHVRGAGAEEFDSIFGMANKSGAENPSMKRKFSRASQDIMRKWQVNDPFRVVGRYITSGVKRAEIVRRFGNEGERWRKLSTQMEKDGVPYEVISEMRELTRGAAGIGIPPRGKAGQTFVDTVTLMTASSAMGRGFLNNLVEPVTIGMRTGNPLDILRAYAETWTRFLRELPGLSPTLRAKMGETFWTQYGHEIGTIHNSIEDAWMTTHSMELDAEYADPRFRWLTNRVYKANLMDATETAKQQASHAIGFSFINRLASMARGDHWTAKLGMDAKQSVADQLSELGIAPEKQADFVEWAKKLQDANDADAMALMLGQDEMAKLHQEAMVRFSMQSSVRSNRAHKPAFQDNPLGKAFLQLMNFSYSYAAEVNSRMYDMAKQSLSFSPEGKNYTAYDRIRMMGPVAGGLLSILAYRGLLELKDLLYPSESSAKRAKDPEVVKWVNATSYAGLLGPKFEQMVKSIKRDQAVGGPVGQMAVNVGRAGKSVLEAAAEGKDMSGAKKSIAKASVPLIKGGIVMGTSAINPALGTVATQATNAPSFTNAIVPQDGKKSGGLTPDVFRLK